MVEGRRRVLGEGRRVLWVRGGYVCLTGQNGGDGLGSGEAN